VRVRGDLTTEGGGRIGRLGTAARLVAAAAIALVGAPVLAAEPAAAAEPVTFLPAGGVAQTYTVPDGVTYLRVLAVGGTGGPGQPANGLPGGVGGRGEIVAANVVVEPGQELNVVVGQNGADGGAPDGGFEGDGDTRRNGTDGGRGGGSSHVVGCATAACPELFQLWAAGGGGGGSRSGVGEAAITRAGRGADVGDAKGVDGGADPTLLKPAIGGRSATVDGPVAAGGSGGDAIDEHCGWAPGGAGGGGGGLRAGSGGDGAFRGAGSGGGGGGGFRRGGGGGGGTTLGGASNGAPCLIGGGGAGGGAGASLVVGGIDPTFRLDGAQNPRVVITPLEAPDTTPLTATVEQADGQPDPTSASPIRFTATFSRAVTGLSTGNVTLTTDTGGTVTAVTDSGDHRTFSIEVTGMTASGSVEVRLPAGAAEDALGNPSAASTSIDATVAYLAPDAVPPSVAIDQAEGQSDPTSSGPIRFTAVFSEPVEGFTAEDVTIETTTGGTVTSLVDTGDHRTFAIEVDGMTADGTVTATIPASAATDLSGNESTASTSSDNVVAYIATTPPPSGPPTASITPSVDVVEGQTARLTITISQPRSAPTVLYVQTFDGPLSASALQWPVPDYQPVSRLVTIPAGATTATVDIRTYADLWPEPTEWFVAALTSLTPGVPVEHHLGIVRIVRPTVG
jgi:hypothetical protein